MDEILTAIGEIKKEILENRNQITGINMNMSTVVNSIELCLSSLKDLKETISSVEKENEKNQKEINQMRNYERRNNVIFFNIAEDNEPNHTALVRKIQGILSEAGVQVEDCYINDCHRIGRKGTRRPVILKLTSQIKKREIFEKRNALVKMGFRISYDNSKEEREEYRKALPLIVELRKKHLNPQFRNGKILLDGVNYSPEEIEQQLRNQRKETSESSGPSGEGNQFRSRASSRLEKFAFMSKPPLEDPNPATLQGPPTKKIAL